MVVVCEEEVRGREEAVLGRGLLYMGRVLWLVEHLNYPAPSNRCCSVVG